MNTGKKRRKPAVHPGASLASGCCVEDSTLQAIEIVRGITARVKEELCVGCGKCARECPASVITIREVGA